MTQISDFEWQRGTAVIGCMYGKEMHGRYAFLHGKATFKKPTSGFHSHVSMPQQQKPYQYRCGVKRLRNNWLLSKEGAEEESFRCTEIAAAGFSCLWYLNSEWRTKR